jgi:signal transduction histidine kinase/DNA-binding response OmpR family regulator
LLARVTYVVLFALTLFLFWKRYQNRILAEQRLETERQKAMAILELDQVKTRFLANITHEFRTPLTLINGHIERLKSQGHFPDAAVQFGEMERNSSHLLQLINQLVDLSKLESGELKLKLTPKDILNDLRVFVFSFNSYAELKNIHLHLELDPATEQRLLNQKLCYDENVLLTIVNNLLSNACKFTEREGTIVFSFRVEEPALRIHIRVSDTGPGIPPEELPKLFDRFYQSDSSMVRSYEGSGIGLSLVKELAILHGGGVSVESQLGVGSTFHVWLQASEAGEEETEASNASVARQRGADRTETSNVASEQEELPLLVLVEDHPDLRRFIRESLGEGYRFAEAVNGAEGLQLASHSIPDLVISDVMMPEMDGFAFCSELKKQTLTSHIPVILLTARVGLDDKLTGLERGADDYLTKPFSARELRLRVHNMLTSRRSLLEKHGLRQDKQKIAAAALPGESVFVGQLVDAITRHMSEPTLAVEGLAEAMNLSSSQLQRKLRAICGKSVQKLIQEVRMENAIELLASGQKNVSEVAFIVGYDDPGYFSKVFKKNFGFLPSERERIKTFFSA